MASRCKPTTSDRLPGLTAELSHLVRTFTALFDSYRPEQHYMRGPGPRWRAKQASRSAGHPPVFPVSALVRVALRMTVT